MEKAETQPCLKSWSPPGLHQIYKSRVMSFLPGEDTTVFSLPFFILIPDSHVEITSID